MDKFTIKDMKDPFDTEVLYNKIQERIATGVFKVGEKISERGLAEEFGVGRFYIKETFRLLERSGLVEVVPQVGTFVRKLSISDLRECHEVRLSLESTAAYFAASRGPTAELASIAKQLRDLVSNNGTDLFQEQTLGWRFHDEMFRASKNQQLCALYANLRAQSGLALTTIPRSDNDVVRKGTVEHIEIFAAIEAHDKILARNLVWEHVLYGLQERLKFFMETAF